MAESSDPGFYTDLASVCEIQMERFLPGYSQEMIPLMLKALHLQKDVTVLDVGCGVGNIGERILNEYPVRHVDCLDADERMIMHAQERLQDQPQVSLHCNDIVRFVPGKQYDRILSSIVLHNVSRAIKTAVLERIYSLLKPGGIFVWSDLIHFDDQQLQETQVQIRREFALRFGAHDEFVERNFAKERRDPTLTVEQMRECLEKAEFRNIQQLWQRTTFALFKVVK